MTQRTDRVYLPPDEPRCAATHGCTRRTGCGRYLAEIGAAPLADYSVPSPSLFGCLRFVDVHRCKRPVVKQERRVFPPLE